MSRKLWVWVVGEKWEGGARGRARVGPVRCSGVITFTSARSPTPRILHIREHSIFPQMPIAWMSISVSWLNLFHILLGWRLLTAKYPVTNQVRSADILAGSA